MSLQEQLLGIERRLWTNDPEYYHDALVEDAMIVFPETGVITRDFAVDAIRTENAEGRRWDEVRFADVRSARLADDVALLNYRVDARWAHEPTFMTVLASSVYVKRDGTWKLAFHQQSPIPGE